LRVRELGGGRFDPFGMVGPELGYGVRFAGVDGAKEILRLMLELIEIRPKGKATIGHDEPPV
jgi:hypothetical protein